MAIFKWLRPILLASICFQLPSISIARPGHSTLESSIPERRIVTTRSIPVNFQLKVLCVGDSITIGVGDSFSNDGGHNGYRLELYNLLTAAGVDSQFIGTQSSGTNNPQPHHEGYGWRAISNISDHLHNNGILTQRPNLVLIHAGTNDNDLPQTADDPLITFAKAPERLGKLIDYILCNDPNAVVLVAKLIQNNYNQTQTNVFNDAVPKVVSERLRRGYKVDLVDMSMIGGDKLSDLLHPNEHGYSELANRWFSAIMAIQSSWWTTSSSAETSTRRPLASCAGSSTSSSPTVAGPPTSPGYHVNRNAIHLSAQHATQDKVFVPGWSDGGIIAIGTGHPGSGVFFADLNGDGRNDYIWANYSKGSEGSIHAWLNGGTDIWNAVFDGNAIAWGEPGATYVELADLTGDKKADYILVVDGKFKVWGNGGPNGHAWIWNRKMKVENQINEMFQNSAPFHYFADMNGDGLADIIAYSSNGVLDFYFNHGPDGNGGLKWTQCRNVGIATGKPFFVDIDGDGTADYVSMDDDGGLSGWINKKGPTACNISWIPINGRGPKSLALGVGAPVAQVRLADFNGDKKADYLVVNDNGGAVHLYPNIGNYSSPRNTAPTATITHGQTIIQDPRGSQITLPTGIMTVTTITESNGVVVTYTPSPSRVSPTALVTRTDSAGHTVISEGPNVFTMPTGVSTPYTVTASGGGIFTFTPNIPLSPTRATPTASLTRTDAGSHTVVSEGSDVFTIPTGLTTPYTATASDGNVYSFTPNMPLVPTRTPTPSFTKTRTDAGGHTIVSEGSDVFTIPTRLTTPYTATAPDGDVFTFPPSAPSSSTSSTSSNIPPGGIFPVLTSVPSPQPTTDGTKMPCKLWFFTICIRWRDINIGGWEFDLPPGPRPPGPPPPISFPPALHIQVNTIGPLPTWPSMSIGPDKIPTYSSQPDQCKTTTGQICLTSITSTVSSSKTASSTASECFTVTGCEAKDSSSTVTSTSSVAACNAQWDFPAYESITETIDPSNRPTLGSTFSATRKTRTSLPSIVTATVPPVPTVTSIDPSKPDSHVECFGPSEYHAFLYSDLKILTAAFCNKYEVLQTDSKALWRSYNTPAYRVWATVGWAQDQAGCSPKTDLVVSSNDRNSPIFKACVNAFLGPFHCGINGTITDSTSSFGGTYKFTSAGCALFEVYARSNAIS